MDAYAVRDRWLNNADQDIRLQIESIEDRLELEDCFYKNLQFGTGGLRGIIGPGPNRMNVHVIAKASQGLANYLLKTTANPSVAIARDSRNMGEEFCRTAASVLSANGIVVYIYPRIEPTPALSFAVRKLQCTAGICITASHNPAKYNGYKVYGSDGCQITTKAAHAIQGEIDAVDVFDDVLTRDFASAEAENLIRWIPDDVIEAYLDGCLEASLSTRGGDLRVAYTPLHGTGLECVTGILNRIGITDVTVEPEQAIPDGDFPTCPYPNPELPEALKKGIELAESINANLLLATDPDADRVGVAVVKNGSARLLSGNEMGILLCDYMCNMLIERKDDISSKVVVTTIVSSVMADLICEHYGFELRRTLTGFKFIGEQIGLLESEGERNRFLFGFEESYGYLAGTQVRDKDAVVSSMLICEMARWYQSQGMDLADAIDSLYQQYGYYQDGLVSIEHPGIKGAQKIQSIMGRLRANAPESVGGLRVLEVVDYINGAAMPISGGSDATQSQSLPPADVLEFKLEGGSRFMLRPSGTEPKVKAYISTSGRTRIEALANLSQLENAAHQLLS